MAEINIASDLTQVSTQLEQLVTQLNQLNSQREQLTQQIHNLNGIAMYLRGKESENGSGTLEDFTLTEEFPPEGA